MQLICSLYNWFLHWKKFPPIYEYTHTSVNRLFYKSHDKEHQFPCSAISDICFAINQQCLLWKMQMFPLKRTSNQISFNQQDVCLGLLRVKQLQNLGSGALTTISEKKKIKDSPSTYNPLRMLRNWKYIFFGKKTITNNCQNLFTFEPSEI